MTGVQTCALPICFPVTIRRGKMLFATNVVTKEKVYVDFNEECELEPDLQEFIPKDKIVTGFTPKAIIYLAPTFRHTNFDGKQIVVHNRLDGVHELFSYNLYPGPSAKKGVYGVLLHIGELEGWVTAHASTVRIITPYQNTLSVMHEGASGGGKSEMLEPVAPIS